MPIKDVESFKETVQALIASCSDKEDSVNNAVIKSLTRLASVHPNQVVEYICEYSKNPNALSLGLLGNLIKVLEQTCVNHMKAVEKHLASELVAVMLQAMTMTMDYEPAVQLGASSVLVAVGHVYLDLVLQTLIKQMTPASVPHYTIPHTLGTLAAVNTQILVPFVKDILGKMLPLLPLVKVEGTKQAFAYAFGHFAVAISEQIGDNVENDSITSIKENFVVEFTVIFDVLYSQWLLTNEPKVSESVLEALGPITRLISERKFNETVNKFVLSLLALYRKTTINAYYISQCISYLLTPSPSNPKLSLNDNVITSINHTLFNLVLLEPDYDQPHSVKNHFEVLRCFDHMAGQFSDQTIESLLHQCKNNNERDRMRAVIILTHLTTSSQVFVSRFSVKFIGILKVMTNMEQGLKMKKLLVKAIVSLVYRNCLVSAEDFLMIEFIIKHCGFEPPNVLKDEIGDLNDTCKSSLILMCNSATHVRTQLRDLLLKALTEEDLSASISTVTHCLSTLLQNNSAVVLVENKEYINEYKVTPDLIFVRCLTYLAEPEQIERNKNILQFLNEYSDEVSKNLNNSWAVEMERLLKFVMKNEPSTEWHTMLLALLSSAIDQINSNKWVENISSLLSQQIVSTKQTPVVKGISLQYLAILTCHMSNAALVEQVLKTILLALKAIPMECVELVSNAVGIASRLHGEHVMNDLDAYFKEVESRRNNKILNFITSRQSKNEDLNVVRYAIIVCYGKVAAECIDVHVLARLSDNVTVIIYEVLKAQPSLDLCRASMATLYEICKALHPALHHNVTLRNRWQLLTIVLEQIYNPNLDKRNIELLPVIVKASTALTKLQKGILPEERNTILRNLFNTVFTELSSFKSKYEIEGNGDQNDQLAKNLNDSLTLIHELIRELIIQSTCLSTIDDLVGILIEWLRHDNDETRTSSILMCQVIFDTYLRNVKLNYETPSKFSQMGHFLGLIVPGIADTNFSVRLTTVDCIKLIIQIQYLYEGHTIEPDDQCIANLTTLQNNILTNDLSMISDYCATFVDVISDNVPHHHIINFIEVLLGGYDNRELRSTGVSAVLNALFTSKGTELYQNVERIVEVVLNTMDDVDEKGAVKLLRPLTSLARHHTNAVTAVLLAQRLPLDYCVVACWRNLALDEELSESIVDNFLRLMTSIELFENSYQMTDRHIAALQPLTLISALGEMLQQPSMKEICINKFAELFSVLYTTLACYMDAEPPAYALPKNKMAEQHGFIPNRDAIKLSPAKITVDTLSAFLEQSECYKKLTFEIGTSRKLLKLHGFQQQSPIQEESVTNLEDALFKNTWNHYKQYLSQKNKIKEACSLCLTIEHGDSVSTLLELVPALSSGVCRSSAQYLARIVNSVATYARSSLPPHRVAALALLADFLKYRCNENVALIETVLATLKTGWNDESGRVRATALRGAANIAMLREEQRANVLPHALCALSQGIDAPNTPSLTDNVPLASIQGLSRLLIEFESIDKEYERELLSISQKIRPYMNTESAQLREHSVKLFGIISSKVKSDALVDQAISSLPCFLLHLCDSNPVVVRASKYTLKQIFKTFSAPRANELVQTHLLDEGRLFIEDFLNALLRLLANELPDTVSRCLQSAVNYLHCAREDLKPYPPLLVGKLYMELFTLRETHPEHSSVDAEVTKSARNRLYHLVKDQDPLVRQHSVLALTYLCLVSASD